MVGRGALPLAPYRHYPREIRPRPTPVPHHPSCHLTGFGGHPRSMSPHSPVPRRRTPHALPVESPHRLATRRAIVQARILW